MEGALHEKIKLTGTLQSTGSIFGTISTTGSLSGALSVPRTVQQTNYERLANKPSIEDVTLSGNKTFNDLGLSALNADDLIEILT